MTRPVAPLVETKAPFQLDRDGWPRIPPTAVTVHRTCGHDDQSRQIICHVDGRYVGQLLYGQALTVEVVPGLHTLRVHNTLFWKTFTFEADPGGHRHFTVANRAPRSAFYLLAVVWLAAAPIWLDARPGLPGDPWGGEARPNGVVPAIRRLAQAVRRLVTTTGR